MRILLRSRQEPFDALSARETLSRDAIACCPKVGSAGDGRYRNPPLISTDWNVARRASSKSS